MSLRGFKRDVSVTSEALDYGTLADHRSFISQPKIIKGECEKPEPHLILYGKDKGPIRAEIFRRNREANGGVNRCWKCSKQVFEFITSDGVEEWRGEWDHIRNKPGERCDCPANGRVVCRKCHSDRHPRPMLGARSEES